jgi:hypothetical protein
MVRLAAEHFQVKLSRLAQEALLTLLRGQAEGIVHGEGLAASAYSNTLRQSEA